MTEKETRFRCMRCQHTWIGVDDPRHERVCPQCKSNSVRKLPKTPKA
jgi:Zn finger protein HypA/HybF involved in hydrogenase expression